jgi:hypothetical protein
MASIGCLFFALKETSGNKRVKFPKIKAWNFQKINSC